MTESIDLVIVGAGAGGMAAGIAARQAGVPCVLLDRRTIVSTPLTMWMFQPTPIVEAPTTNTAPHNTGGPTSPRAIHRAHSAVTGHSNRPKNRLPN